MSMTDDELHRLLAPLTLDPDAEGPGTGRGRPTLPLAHIVERAGRLRRARRIRRGTAAASCLAVVAGVVALAPWRGAGGELTTVPAHSSKVLPTSGSPAAPKMPTIALTGNLGCRPAAGDGVASAQQLDSVPTVAGLPSHLLALPSAELAGTPDSATGGWLACYRGHGMVSWFGPLGSWSGPAGTTTATTAPRVLRITPEEAALSVNGPDDRHPCATAQSANAPFGGTRTTGTVRGVPVTLDVRSSGNLRTCARWTEPDGHTWYAVSSSPDTTAVLGWIGSLRLTATGADPAGRLSGLTQFGGALMPYGADFSPAHSFVETHGYAPGGLGWSLAVIDPGEVQAPAGPGAEKVAVRGVTGWWLAGEQVLIWREGDGPWFLLRASTGRADALRLAGSIRPAAADDPRWRVYLTTDNGYHGTPPPPPGVTPTEDLLTGGTVTPTADATGAGVSWPS